VVNTGSSVSHGRVAAIAGSAAVRPVLNQFYAGEIAVETGEQDWLSGMGGKLHFTPSASLRALIEAPVSPTLGRNQACWCGSGKKFKRCHGRWDLRCSSRRLHDWLIKWPAFQ
jgi:hypothetical protein